MKAKLKVLGMVLVAALMAFCLMACGGGTSPSGTDSQDGGGSSAQGTFDVGKFTVSVPKDWKAFPQTDMFGEKDENGDYPVDETTIFMAKGAADEWDALTAPNVRIYYYDADAIVLDTRDFYDNVEEITGVAINGKDCTAFSGESLGYVYDFIHYEADDAIYDISVLTSIDGNPTGINWSDADVMAIMESLSAK